MDQITARTAPRDDAQGIALDVAGRRVALKWHRLRRRRADPLFGLEALRQGLRLGASMEIDLRATADGGFVVLHYAMLERETDGDGDVIARTTGELAGLHYADGAEAARRRLLLVEDMAALMADAHADALLQFDMKDDLTRVGERGLASLGRLAAGSRGSLVVSGECLALIEGIKQALPDVKRGIDPTDRLVALLRDGRTEAVAEQLRREIAGPTEPAFVYLDWRLVLAAREAGIDLVAICHEAGTTVDAWTFNLADPEAGFDDGEWRDFRRLLDLGVDQVTTDEAIATERAYKRRIAAG